MHDVQSGPDHRQLRIDKVGVRGLRFPIQIRDKAHRHQNTIATIAMSVDLPKEFKGTHMSRFVEVLNARRAEMTIRNMPAILTDIQRRLDSDDAHLVATFGHDQPSPEEEGEQDEHRGGFSVHRSKRFDRIIRASGPRP